MCVSMFVKPYVFNDIYTEAQLEKNRKKLPRTQLQQIGQSMANSTLLPSLDTHTSCF